MAAKKGKKAQPSRVSAEKLLLDFIQSNKITLIVDEVTALNTDVKDAVYVVIKRPRVRAYYLDEIQQIKPGNGQPPKPRIDIAN